MKSKILFVVITLLLVSVISYSGVVVKQFSAEALGIDKVKIKWIVNNETNVKGYNVYRSFDGLDFTQITFIQASSGAGEKIYSFIDKSVFKTEGRTFYYKIDYVNSTDNSRTEISQPVVQVTPQISSTRHTWGSIKAMFR